MPLPQRSIKCKASRLNTNRELGICGFAARALPGGTSNVGELEANAKADLDLPVASRFLLCRAAT